MRPCASMERSASSSARYPECSRMAVAAGAMPSVAARSKRVTRSRRSWIPPSALPVTPATAASRSASRNVRPAVWAYASILPTDVSPTPRLGTFTMRFHDTSSSGFTRARR